MKNKLFSIYDKVKEEYGPLNSHKTIGDAIRAVQIVTQQKDNILGSRPKDFSLWELGEFDDENGVSGLKPKLVVEVSELMLDKPDDV